MEFTTQAALIIAGIVAIIAGIFGVGFKAGGIEVPKLAGWKQSMLVIAGLLLISLGVALTPEIYSLIPNWGNEQRSDDAASQADETATSADELASSDAEVEDSPPAEQGQDDPPTTGSEAPQAGGQPEPPPISPEYAWVSDLVRLPAGVSIAWQPCNGEPAGTCVRWNMYEHNGGVPLPMEILTCAQDGTYLDESGVEQGGLQAGSYERVSGITVRRCTSSVPQLSMLCGDDFYDVVFSEGLADVTYTFPEGYGTGYISSDPAVLELPSGEVLSMGRQFVLIVEGLPFVKVSDVGGRMNGGAPVPNTFGCAYPGSDPAAAKLRGSGDFNEKVLNNNAAELYRLTASGLELLNSHQP